MLMGPFQGPQGGAQVESRRKGPVHADRAIAGHNERDRTAWRHVVDEEQLVDVIDGLGDVVAVIGRLGRPSAFPAAYTK